VQVLPWTIKTNITLWLATVPRSSKAQKQRFHATSVIGMHCHVILTDYTQLKQLQQHCSCCYFVTGWLFPAVDAMSWIFKRDIIYFSRAVTIKDHYIIVCTIFTFVSTGYYCFFMTTSWLLSLLLVPVAAAVFITACSLFIAAFVVSDWLLLLLLPVDYFL